MARQVTDVTRCAVTERGAAFNLTLGFDDGTSEIIPIAHYVIEKLVPVLIQTGHGAAKIRTGVGQTLVEDARPFHVKRISRHAFDPQTGEVVLQIAVTEGFPLILAMSQDQAENAIAALRAALSFAESATPGKSN